MEKNRVLSMLGLARRAGKLSMGHDTALSAVLDYKAQMDQFTQLLTDDTVDEVVLPSINDWQGPLMHMPVTGNPDAWTNQKVKEFFGKQSVTAIPRQEWESGNSH
jgi:hypothetical protein